MSKKPDEILLEFYGEVQDPDVKFISSKDLLKKIELICRCNSNKAPIRFLMSCMLAKVFNPALDVRKPYTEIPGEGTFSGRKYDEAFIQKFVYDRRLPCNSTTAYLTPAFRNIDRVLTPELVLVGKPSEIYTYALQVLDAVHKGNETAENVLKEIIRLLVVIRGENEARMSQLLKDLDQSQTTLPLSSEEIINLLTQHLSIKNASRLPVLIVAAAYFAVGSRIGESANPLEAHNAADKQTGALGDVEVTLENDDKVVTSYEMKDKRVTRNDIDVALEKLRGQPHKIDNYIFITTDVIDQDVVEYAKSFYEKTAVEFAILDCVGFMKHFLHFFHRSRIEYLNIYQELVLKEPTSSVSQPLKEAFLALRRAAEADRGGAVGSK